MTLTTPWPPASPADYLGHAVADLLPEIVVVLESEGLSAAEAPDVLLEVFVDLLLRARHRDICAPFRDEAEFLADLRRQCHARATR